MVSGHGPYTFLCRGAKLFLAPFEVGCNRWGDKFRRSPEYEALRGLIVIIGIGVNELGDVHILNRFVVARPSFS